MSETGVDFGVLLDSQRARIEKDAENAEATHAEQLKEAEASLAKRIASALFFLETQPKFLARRATRVFCSNLSNHKDHRPQQRPFYSIGQ